MDPSEVFERMTTATSKQSWALDFDDKRFAALARAIAKQCNTFGVMQLREIINYSSPPRLESNVKILVDGQDCGTIGEPDVDKLASLATEAPFGRDGETVADTAVRDALEISASRLTFRVKDNQADVNVVEKGFPWLTELAAPGTHLEGKLYKMHIYRKGGKFMPHIDTAHGPDHAATLVVQLDTPHEGGTLVVTKHGVSMRMTAGDVRSRSQEATGADSGDEAAAASAPKPRPKMALLGAFYTDCVHSVEPVTEGTLVAIQFDLHTVRDRNPSFAEYARFERNEEDVERLDAMPDGFANQDLVDEFKRILIPGGPGSEGNNGAPLLIVLIHRYRLDGMGSGLKGSDRFIKAAAEAAGAQTLALPVMFTALKEERLVWNDFSIGSFTALPEAEVRWEQAKAVTDLSKVQAVLGYHRKNVVRMQEEIYIVDEDYDLYQDGKTKHLGAALLVWVP